MINLYIFLWLRNFRHYKKKKCGFLHFQSDSVQCSWPLYCLLMVKFILEPCIIPVLRCVQNNLLFLFFFSYVCPMIFFLLFFITETLNGTVQNIFIGYNWMNMSKLRSNVVLMMYYSKISSYNKQFMFCSLQKMKLTMAKWILVP